MTTSYDNPWGDKVFTIPEVAAYLTIYAPKSFESIKPAFVENLSDEELLTRRP